MRSKSMILILVSLGFGAVAAVGMVQVISHSSGTQEEERIPVLVALDDLNIKDELTVDNVQIELFPVSLVPEGVVTSWEEADGKKIMARVPRGMPIMQEMILDKHALTDVEVPPGYKVIAINVDARDSFHGLLKPGHRVDVIAIRSIGDSDQAKTFLKNVSVYAVDDKTDRIPVQSEAGTTVSTVQLVVNQQQAEAIALYESEGRIRLVLGSETESKEPELIEDVGLLANDTFRPRENEQASTLGEMFSAALGLIKPPGENQEPATDATGTQPTSVNRPAAPASTQPQHTMMVMMNNGAVVNYQWSDRSQLPVLQPTVPTFATPGFNPSSTPGFDPNATPAGATNGSNVPATETSFDYVDDGAE